jgi:hypothetical protein
MEAVQVYEVSKPFCIPNVHGFHPWDVAATKLTGIDQFLSNSQVFSSHRDEFQSESSIQHPWLLYPSILCSDGVVSGKVTAAKS